MSGLSKADEDRILLVNASALIQVYRRKREQILAQLHTEYYSPDQDYDAIVCRFAQNEDMIKDLERRLAQNR